MMSTDGLNLEHKNKKNSREDTCKPIWCLCGNFSSAYGGSDLGRGMWIDQLI